MRARRERPVPLRDTTVEGCGRLTDALFLVRPVDGGVATHARAVAAEFARRGLEVRCVAVSRGPGAAWRGLALAVRERHALRTAGAVHAEFGRLDTGVFWFALAASLLRRDVVLIAHDAPILVRTPAAALVPWRGVWAERLAYRVLAPLLDRSLCRLLLARVASVAVLSEEAVLELRAAQATHVALARPGANASTVAAPPPSAGRHVLFAGYIASAKGLDVLLEAWRSVSRSTPLDLVVAGGPATDNDVGYFEALRAEAGLLPRVRWRGSVDDASFEQLVADAAVVCLPYRYSNPFSAVLAHAMSEGRAILATAVPAVRNTLDAGCAVIVPIGDVQALADGLTRLLSDPDLRDRLGAAVAARARATTWPVAVDDRLRLMR